MVLQSEVRVLAEAVDWLTLGRLSVHWLEYLFLELCADFMLFLDTGSERERERERSCSHTNVLTVLKKNKKKNHACLEGNNSLVPGRMSDMSIKGPEFWIRAWWCSDTPVQKFCGFTDWLNSVSVTGTAALSSPGKATGRE